MTAVIRVLLNVVWLVFAGFWMAVGYVVAGVLACLLIVTIPFGIASFRIANFALWPFGRTVVHRADAGVPSVVGNVLWVLLFGWWLALGHIITGIALILTIIGTPMAIANFKLVPVSLLPLGRAVVSIDRVTAGTSGALTVPR